MASLKSRVRSKLVGRCGRRSPAARRRRGRWWWSERRGCFLGGPWWSCRARRPSRSWTTLVASSWPCRRSSSGCLPRRCRVARGRFGRRRPRCCDCSVADAAILGGSSFVEAFAGQSGSYARVITCGFAAWRSGRHWRPRPPRRADLEDEGPAAIGGSRRTPSCARRQDSRSRSKPWRVALLRSQRPDADRRAAGRA